MVKRLISIFVLTIFLAHFAGFYVYFVFQLNKNRLEMRARLRELPADQLEVIKLSRTEFDEAKEDEHEIKVLGRMYDIARVVVQDSLVVVYCLHDAAEDNILAFLDKVLASPLRDDHTAESMIQFFSLTYIPSYWNLAVPHFGNEKSFTVYTESNSVLRKEAETPPPKS